MSIFRNAKKLLIGALSHFRLQMILARPDIVAQELYLSKEIQSFAMFRDSLQYLVAIFYPMQDNKKRA